jgi:hypothetical protein
MRRTRLAALFVIGAGLWTACSDFSREPLGPTAAPPDFTRVTPNLRAALAAQERHTAALLRVSGVVGTAVGLTPDGKATVRLLLADASVTGLPAILDGVPVTTQVTGMFFARSDPTKRQRPAPLGFSVGHPAITAGSIGGRVVDGTGRVFVLSNNHVLANSNGASIGDAALQPGPFDGGTAPADQIGTLAAFKPIDFAGGANTIDAAIAVSSTDNLSNATPADEGYGLPNSAIYGDANGDGVFDDKNALLGLAVQKYGRTTKSTHGQITGINATVTVCYEVLFIFCIKQATFVDQLIIEPGGFSGGGDSGSLIVADDGTNRPVGLLFAGSSTQTIANRIDLVLNNFGVRIDGSEPPPPPPPPAPVTDLAITSVGAPASATRGNTVNVSVAVKNAGNQNIPAGAQVTLNDETDATTIGTETLQALAPGATATLVFPWNTTNSSLGTHVLRAQHTLVDDNPANDEALASVTLNNVSLIIHVGDLDGMTSRSGNTWSATVEITVHDADHNPLNGATVVGHWSQIGLNSDTCTTGELGGNGTCIVLFPSLKRSVSFVNMTVVSVTYAGKTYDRTFNHDPDGDSNGTTIRLLRPF